MTVLILGQRDDLHAKAVAEHLDRPIILDDYLIENHLTMTAEINDTPQLYLCGEPLKPSAVYWRNLDIYPFTSFHFPNSVAQFKLFLNAFPDIPVINPPESFAAHYTKIDQMRLTSDLMPASLMTNRYENAVEFAKNFDEGAVKPIAGGDYVLRWSELERITEPVMLQEFIAGDNIRTFVVGDNVYSAIAESDLDDFRLDKNFTYTPIELTQDENQQALDIAKSFGYKWTAIDWIRRDGRLYFLEANFSPMFIFFEQQTQYPITEKLVELLIQ